MHVVHSGLNWGTTRGTPCQGFYCEVVFLEGQGHYIVMCQTTKARTYVFLEDFSDSVKTARAKLKDLLSKARQLELKQNEILKSKFEEMLSVNEKCSLLVFGDLNARTGKELDYILDDNVERISGLEWYTVIDFSRWRELKDNHGNIFGRTSL